MPDYYPNKGPAPVAVAAAGSTQANAAALTLGALNVVSAADGTKGVVLPVGAAGDVVRVYSSVATNGLKIYPPSGGDINDGTADAAITIEGKSYALLECVDGTTWAANFVVNS